MKGFTLIELIIVVAIIGILMNVSSVLFDDYFEQNSLKTAINKVRYDIIYMRNLKYASTENFKMKFKSTSERVEVNGIDEVRFDYVCFNDKNNNDEPDFSEDKELNEIIKDPMTKKYMMYDFDSSKYTKREFKNIILEEVKFYNKTEGIKTLCWFDKLGEMKVRKNANEWEELKYFGEMDIEHNFIELKNGNKGIKLILFPLSNDMKIY